jgi:MFS transporter, ACS family, hexuronate transporter
MMKNFTVLFCAQIFVCFGGLTIPPLIPFIQSDLKLNYTQIGAIMSFLYFGAVIMSLPAGWLTDRLGVKRMLLLSQAFMGFFVAMFSLTGNYFMAILFAFAMGLGYGMVNPPTTKGIMVLVKKEKRGMAMSVKQTGVPIGSAIAAALLPPLALRFSWGFSFVFAGGIVILSGLLSQVFYQQSREKPNSFSSEPAEAPPGNPKQIYPIKNIIYLGIGCAFCSLVQIALVTYIILYLRDDRKADLVLAGFCLTLVNIGGILGRIFWGVVSDWLFSRKVTLKLIAVLIFLVSLVLGLNLSLPLVPLFIIVFLFGFSAVGWNGVYHAFVGELSGKEKAGRAIGLSMTITFLGNVIGPVLFGKIIDLTGSYSMAWYFLCVSMVGALIAFSMINEEKVSTPLAPS